MPVWRLPFFLLILKPPRYQVPPSIIAFPRPEEPRHDLVHHPVHQEVAFSSFFFLLLFQEVSSSVIVSLGGGEQQEDEDEPRPENIC